MLLAMFFLLALGMSLLPSVGAESSLAIAGALGACVWVGARTADRSARQRAMAIGAILLLLLFLVVAHIARKFAM